MLHDLRFSLRMLHRDPAFTLVTVLVLALGIGANTVIFSLVDAVLLRSLPYRDPEQLVWVWEKPPGGLRNNVSAALSGFFCQGRIPLGGW